jgi:hypothetical protein
LRVKPAVVRVIVFRLTRGTHPERAHRSVRPVIGQRFDDAEPRATVRAIGERIAKAAVGRIEDFALTIWTRRHIGQDERRLAAASFTGADHKSLVTHSVEPRSLATLDETARRFLGCESVAEIIQLPQRALDFDADALRRIVHPTGQTEFDGEPIDKRSETDALHRAPDHQAQPRRLATGDGDSGSHVWGWERAQVRPAALICA